MAWVTIENQRLVYQKLNQKALRADTYKSLKEATEERARELAPRGDGMYQDGLFYDTFPRVEFSRIAESSTIYKWK